MKNFYFLHSRLPSAQRQPTFSIFPLFCSSIQIYKSHPSMSSSSSIPKSDHHEFNPYFSARQQQQHQQPPVGSSLKLPTIRKTNPLTWITAFCCAIFWVIIILGGLAVLIVYLAFKPRSPRFDISSVTLNAAYIDTGLLNADLTILANFSNPNKKVSVEFSFMVLHLYYDQTLIATRAIDPFSTTSTESRLRSVEMISSQVPLPIDVSEQLRKQMEGNGIIFKLKGSFRTRSYLGSFHYSYWLYSSCIIATTAPPSGVLVAHKCRTKR